MFPGMRQSFIDCPEVVIMDCTYNTNRFKKPLMVVTILNQERQAMPVAFGLLDAEDIHSFEWFNSTFTDAVGSDAVKRIRVIITDGQSAFVSTLSRSFPGAAHHRCLWHIEQNLATNLKLVLGKDWNTFMAEFKDVYSAMTEAEYVKASNQLLANHPKAAKYLTVNIFPTHCQWVACWVSQVFTIGIRTTGSGESMNRAIKLFSINRHTPLVKLFNELKKMGLQTTERMKDKHQQKAHNKNLISSPHERQLVVSSHRILILALILDWQNEIGLSFWAAGYVREQADLAEATNYKALWIEEKVTDANSFIVYREASHETGYTVTLRTDVSVLNIPIARLFLCYVI
jgi:hypothetical protein